MKPLLALTLLSGCAFVPIDLGEGEPMPARYAVTGYDLSCYVVDGVVKCAGTNERGQVPLGANGSAGSTCEGLPCTSSVQTAGLPAFDELVLGLGFGCIRAQGSVTCWGGNGLGQLARGLTDDAPHTFVAVPIDELDDVLDLAAGRHHVCALRRGGHVECWGSGARGVLGVAPEDLATCTANDATDAASLEVAVGSSVACATRPRRVPGIDDATRLFAGPFATCVERMSDAIVCFGQDDVGQLGTGDIAPNGARTKPTRSDVRRVRSLVLGARHGCALEQDGGIRCFGANDFGQLAIGPGSPDRCGDTPCSLAPFRTLFAPDAIDLVATEDGTCAVYADGTIACAGLDAFGELGDSDHSSPVLCEGLPCSGTPVLVYDAQGQYRASGAGSVVAAGHHLVGRTPSGTFFTWGDNRRRQTGSTSPSPITFPAEVYGLDP